MTADASRGGHLDLTVSRHRGALPGVLVLPEFVLGSLSGEPAAVSGQMTLKVAFLHAAISTGSTSAHPVGGIGSPRERRSSSTSAIASRTISRA